MMLRKILTSSFSLFFAFTLLTTSCEAQLTEEQALANLRQMSAEGRSPSEDYVAGIESRFAGKRTGLLAKLLRATGKRVLVAANKSERARVEAEAGEFYKFGFEEVFPVSAEQGIGLGDLLDALVKDLKFESSDLESDLRFSDPDAEQEGDTTAQAEQSTRPRELRLAIIGRPNVGKSSLLNRLLKEERVLVSDMPGTTRDAIDAVLIWHRRRFRIVDTAGMRRPGRRRKRPRPSRGWPGPCRRPTLAPCPAPRPTSNPTSSLTRRRTSSPCRSSRRRRRLSSSRPRPPRRAAAT